MSKVFVSHATVDVALAKLLVNFLKEAIGVPDKDIFCTSLPGHSIPLMEDFNEYIRKQIEQPAIVLALLTPSYLESHFCLMELGAAWSKATKTLAVVTPKVSFDVVTKTLGLKQAWRIDDHTKLSEFRGAFEGMTLETRSTETWEGKADEWKKRLRAVLRGLPSPKLVSKHDLDVALSEIEMIKRASTAEAERLSDLHRELEEENVALRKRLADKEAGLPRALIVEPERLVALDLQQLLTRARYDVIGVAKTKQEAIIMAFAERPEIIVTEIELADGSSGIDLVNALYPHLDCFAIFVTAYPEKLLIANRPEPIELITKPFSPDHLLEKVAGARKLLIERRALAKPQEVH
ncbi:TIR domain-containing protein [Rhizobium laguerreae]|uniref:TIR domain-containing protein n=1 Tax=Rhizobium laguerreae TaxID=1076926 RepID=UPI001440FFD3|nr:TIR domain-containing protein [Rhizobium laguerreae]MBY3262221.1 TIR domain-containing protein [Rhizobium laguerreae]MBY3338743.1 TIR domain-containing protein [Rhizobium laguerreae]NKM16983.1 TIR domain-containing protein [Rhizobium laguerreae]